MHLNGLQRAILVLGALATLFLALCPPWERMCGGAVGRSSGVVASNFTAVHDGYHFRFRSSDAPRDRETLLRESKRLSAKPTAEELSPHTWFCSDSPRIDLRMWAAKAVRARQ
jgi:hypothetical protein